MSPFASTLLLSLVTIAAGCQENTVVLPTCPEATATSPAVTGTYRYRSDVFGLSGTITFAQEGGRLFVTDTTYTTGDDRALEGDGPMQGNRATVRLVPRNGDTDYTADVTFAFTPDGNEFCLVEFTDTNGDRGGEGTYVGVKE